MQTAILSMLPYSSCPTITIDAAPNTSDLYTEDEETKLNNLEKHASVLMDLPDGKDIIDFHVSMPFRK
jgi:hypothetical protein